MEIKGDLILGIAAAAVIGYLGYKAADKWFPNTDNKFFGETSTPTIENKYPGLSSESVADLTKKINSTLADFNVAKTSNLSLFEWISGGFAQTNDALKNLFGNLKNPDNNKSVLATIDYNQPYSSKNNSYNPNLFAGGLKYVTSQQQNKIVDNFNAGLIDNKKINLNTDIKANLQSLKKSGLVPAVTIPKAAAPKNNNWSVGAPTVPGGKYGGAVYGG